ncbi:Gfo/Idh/MocA family protein [Flavihumibacter profundi]|uniref:Gfo/Idh/MocA family protein n=1 Tax=Flavihumibacter profundi TaxID=2716883 RepID=UPI001CC34D42|nr:Gfo/Idh/MocA family oxidoreductase [Flavihumibacter profundi]MBZ5858964.1 Gfo/Idh/MocA family oxidoreductase [Flavihumibacter profundi]
MLDRRKFLIQSALAGTGLILGGGLNALAKSPNEKIIIGAVGTNSRGFYLARMFAVLPNIEVAYICDVDDNVLAKTIAEIEKLSGKRPKGFKDVRKLLELKDLDAIVIATPDHWHAPATLMALQAGKHVYVEKPCSHNPAEGELLVAGQQKYGKLIQMGNQRRSFPNVIAAMNELHNSVIGRVYFAKGWYAANRKSIGNGKPAAVPAYLDFDLWQGPAPRKNYMDNLVPYNWHWFWHWGTGEALNNGTHELDVMRWGLGVNYPTKVVSAGGRFAFNDDWETPDTQTITFEFPDKKAMLWESRSCNPFEEQGSSRGVIFYGEKGTMVIPGGDDYKIFDQENKLVREVKTSIQKADTTNTMGAGEKLDSLHLVNFAEAIRGKSQLVSPIQEGFRSTLLPQLGNIAYRTGRALHCDPSNGHILNDADALKLWRREYAPGWEMKL